MQGSFMFSESLPVMWSMTFNRWYLVIRLANQLQIRLWQWAKHVYSDILFWCLISMCSSSTHEKKTKTYVINKQDKFYLKHNCFSEVRTQFSSSSSLNCFPICLTMPLMKPVLFAIHRCVRKKCAEMRIFWGTKDCVLLLLFCRVILF